MIFHSLALNNEGMVTASAEGHANEVVEDFHSVCSLLLAARGPWRITQVVGACEEGTELDSEMQWTLIAKVK